MNWSVKNSLIIAIVPLISFAQWNPIVAFSSQSLLLSNQKTVSSTKIAGTGSSNGGTTVTSIDVSDLGLTMEDLEKPIPKELFGDFKVTTSGCQSTSRIESINDEGCLWEESADSIDVTMSIEGLRGQPSAAMDIAFSTTSCTVTVFGYAVWSCVLRGEILPESATFRVEDGHDMTPLITLSVVKKKEGANEERWGGFIETIGEDSIL